MPLTNSQINRLGDRLRAGPASDEDLRLLDEFQQEFTPALAETRHLLEDALTAVLGEGALRPTARIKQLRSIIEKLNRLVVGQFEPDRFLLTSEGRASYAKASSGVSAGADDQPKATPRTWESSTACPVASPMISMARGTSTPRLPTAANSKERVSSPVDPSATIIGPTAAGCASRAACSRSAIFHTASPGKPAIRTSIVAVVVLVAWVTYPFYPV
jgi:hypothetical protein